MGLLSKLTQVVKGNNVFDFKTLTKLLRCIDFFIQYLSFIYTLDRTMSLQYLQNLMLWFLNDLYKLIKASKNANRGVEEQALLVDSISDNNSLNVSLYFLHYS